MCSSRRDFVHECRTRQRAAHVTSMGTGASCASELDVIEEDGAASTGGEASGSLEITVKLDAALSTSGSLGNGAATTASSPITNYEVLRKIGRGSYGTVFLVRDQRDGLYYCAKQVMLELGSEEERRAAELEVATLRKLDHPSVVAYHEHFLYEDAAAGQSLCLVMAYCEGGDLARLIKTHAEKVLWAPIALNHASNAASDCMLSVI